MSVLSIGKNINLTRQIVANSAALDHQIVLAQRIIGNADVMDQPMDPARDLNDVRFILFTICSFDIKCLPLLPVESCKKNEFYVPFWMTMIILPCPTLLLQ
jgi:hypothetical protein